MADHTAKTKGIKQGAVAAPPASPAPTKRKKVSILPISAEDIRDPAKFSQWVFFHTPLILQQLFDTLPDAPPGEQIKVLHALYSTSLSFRPYSIVKENVGNEQDPASALAELLRQTKEVNDEQ